jgi:hypothetical protein
MIRYHPEIEEMFKANKYHNKKIETEDGKFDSKYEYQKWCELKLLEKAGEISNLKRQYPITLLPKITLNGNTILPVKYIADFIYDEKGKTIIVDTKGYETPEYKIKKKLLLHNVIDKIEFAVFMECKKGKPDKIYK